MRSRRRFLTAIGAPALIGLTAKGQSRIAGGFVDDDFSTGHRIRDGAPFPAARRTETFPIVIVGGGMAGLCAAWRLEKRGFRDYILLEMEAQAGGNSRWGENGITPYPWAAHYVPVPGVRAKLVRELFAELGVLDNGEWNERHLCFSPQERLYLHGRWQEGLAPEIAASPRDHDEYRRFDDAIAEMRATGQFTIPLEDGARESDLDRVSFEQWMRDRGFASEYLHWYANYACRDDYGSLARDTSAWAGLHYFASREPDEDGPLTWPEGNGWIARRLIDKLNPRIWRQAAVYAVVREGRKWRVRTEAADFLAERVIFAAPSFLAPHLIEDAPPAEGFVYSPWLTANLTLTRPPADRGEAQGAPRAWDNVIYDSPALGYVVATHQSLRTFEDRSVWTYYWALAGDTPGAGRALLLQRDYAAWSEAILADLERAHRDIRQCVARIDIKRMGHAMIRPAPGFLTSPARKRFVEGASGIYYANSDVSGISIFEEAQYRGVLAADRALRDAGRG